MRVRVVAAVAVEATVAAVVVVAVVVLAAAQVPAWATNVIDEKLFKPGTGMLLSPGTERFAPQLLLLLGMLAGPPLFPKPPCKLAGTLLFFD